jgi:hypothetical protein
MQSLKKVVLLEPVAGLGLQGDVVPVKAGRARNVLIPRKQALYVSGNMHKPSPFLPQENFISFFHPLPAVSIVMRLRRMSLFTSKIEQRKSS